MLLNLINRYPYYIHDFHVWFYNFVSSFIEYKTKNEISRLIIICWVDNIGEWENRAMRIWLPVRKGKQKKQLWCVVVDLDKRDVCVCVYVHTKHLFIIAHHDVLICLLLNWSWPFIIPYNDPWFFKLSYLF